MISPQVLTRRQWEVVRMRYERGAPVHLVAQWLRISRRSVLLRLRSARRTAMHCGMGGCLGHQKFLKSKRQRERIISQMRFNELGGAVTLDDL